MPAGQEPTVFNFFDWPEELGDCTIQELFLFYPQDDDPVFCPQDPNNDEAGKRLTRRQRTHFIGHIMSRNPTDWFPSQHFADLTCIFRWVGIASCPHERVWSVAGSPHHHFLTCTQMGLADLLASPGVS